MRLSKVAFAVTIVLFAMANLGLLNVTDRAYLWALLVTGVLYGLEEIGLIPTTVKKPKLRRKAAVAPQA